MPGETPDLRLVLGRYLYKEDVQDLLADIGLPVTGTKDELLERLVRAPDFDVREAVAFVDKESLKEIAEELDLPVSGTRSDLAARVSEFLRVGSVGSTSLVPLASTAVRSHRNVVQTEPGEEGRTSRDRVAVTEVMDEIIVLSPGQERHFRFDFLKGSIVTVTCHSGQKFYAGLFTREEYVARRGAGGLGMFGFDLGTDRHGYTKRIQVPLDDEYYVVVRVGVFAQTARVSVRVTLRL